MSLAIPGTVAIAAESVTRGDLQHHRWVLESVDDKSLQTEETDGNIPELDFGERMQVSGNTGCNRFSGTAVLRSSFFLIEGMVTTARACKPEQNELERKIQTLLGSESTISLDEDRKLTLESSAGVFVFRLRDWVS